MLPTTLLPFSSAYYSPTILQRLPFSSAYHSPAPTILQRLPVSSASQSPAPPSLPAPASLQRLPVSSADTTSCRYKTSLHIRQGTCRHTPPRHRAQSADIH